VRPLLPVFGRRPALLFPVLLLLLAGPPACTGSAPGTRSASVAGSFYPADPDRLREAVLRYMEGAVSPQAPGVVAIVVPHAGYVYSGQIAADGFRQAEGKAISTVVILGTNHTSRPFRGASLWYGGAYETPLGLAPVDEDVAAALRTKEHLFPFRRDTHEREHSVEVEVPFVQVLFPDAKIVPMVVGSSDPDICQRLGEAIAEAVEGKDVLIVASSDLSHYPPHDEAMKTDLRYLRAVATMDAAEVKRTVREEMARGASGLSTCACGEGPILVAMAAARELGARRAVALSYANSGETPLGDWDRCVGYGAVAFCRGGGEADLSGLNDRCAAPLEGSLTSSQREYLLGLARRTIDQYLATGTAPLPRPDDPALYAKRGAFVTLNANGRLRGCIGHMAEDRPLCEVVAAMAMQAAFNDRRFEPLTEEEWPDVSIEVSVLTPYRAIGGPGEIVIGRDGVVLRSRGRSAVYLPQVAPEQGWDREETLTHLCAKAGLGGDCWRSADLFTFQAEVFHESE